MMNWLHIDILHHNSLLKLIMNGYIKGKLREEDQEFKRVCQKLIGKFKYNIIES